MEWHEAISFLFVPYSPSTSWASGLGCLPVYSSLFTPNGFSRLAMAKPTNHRLNRKSIRPNRQNAFHLWKCISPYNDIVGWNRSKVFTFIVLTTLNRAMSSITLRDYTAYGNKVTHVKWLVCTINVIEFVTEVKQQMVYVSEQMYL